MGSIPVEGTNICYYCPMRKLSDASASQTNVVKVDISWNLLIKLAVAALVVWLAYILRDILFLVFVVFIFVAAVDPTIKQMQRKMSRTLAVTFFFLILVLALGAGVWLFVPRVIDQITNLIKQAPEIIDQVRPFLTNVQSEQINSLLDNASQGLAGSAKTVSTNIWQAVAGVFGGIAALVTALVLAFYILLEEKAARLFFHNVLPPNRYDAVYQTIRKISEQMGSWIRGQVTVMAIVGLLNVLCYWAIGVPSPLPLGIWSGLLELVPYVGPVLGVLPGVVVAATTGDILKVVLVLALNYGVIQQLQNFVITPRVMGKAIGLSPVLLILAMLAGVSIFGVIGAVIAIPCAAIIAVVVGEWGSLRKTWDNGQRDGQEVAE
jgi:predicted PurR-regulated permease PerM